MEYHYSEICLPSEHLTEHYNAEYVAPYIINPTEAEYHVRSTILADGGDRFGISAVVFDKHEELIWMGNQGGHVTSYYGPSLQKYTSFQIHDTEEVRDLLTLEQGLYALTKTTLRHQMRRGIPKQTFRSEHMTDMQCLFQVSNTKFLMGGHQNKLLELDLNTMKETIVPIEEEGCAVLRSGGGGLVACGSVNGMVTLRDVRSPVNVEHSFKAHSACLSDLDMQGDLLITCGFTQSTGGAVAEPYVMVWDVRRLRGRGAAAEGWRAPAGAPAPPLLLHFLPAVSGRAVAVAGDGHVSLLDVSSPDNKEKPSVFQVDTQSSLCRVMDVSSSSQALIFGDQSGHLNLFSPQQNTDPVFNGFSRETEFAHQTVGVPSASFNDKKFRFSSVPLPPLASGSKWFNVLPEEFFKKVFRTPKTIDPEVLKTMKLQGPIGYAPNPGTARRNQVDMRYSKQAGNRDVEEDYNKTGYPGLEGHLPNSYCNPMLQILYYTAPVKATLLAHTCTKEFCLSCELGYLFRMLDNSNGEPCQASNFLRAFRTVPEAAALGLILPDRGDLRVDFSALIQSWNRFILHQMHYDILECRKKEKQIAMMAQNANSPPTVGSRLGNPPLVATKINPSVQSPPTMNGHFGEVAYSDPEFGAAERAGPAAWRRHDGLREDGIGEVRPQACDHIELNNQNADKEETEISQLFAIGRHQLNKCLKCNKEEERESVVLACALQAGGGGGGAGGGFAEALRASLSSRRSTPAWCERCRRFSPTLQRGRVVRLPPILAINCGEAAINEKEHWANGVQKEMNDNTKRSVGGKPCRYGLHCARPGCRFKHPDRPQSSSPSHNSVTKSPTREPRCVLPHQLLIRLQPDGDIVINDQRDELSPRNGPDADGPEEEYSLSAVVVCVDDNPNNLVAFINMAASGEPRWYMFNDLSIMPTTADEVVQYSAWWKSPCVLFYTAKELAAIRNASAYPTNELQGS